MGGERATSRGTWEEGEVRGGGGLRRGGERERKREGMKEKEKMRTERI